MDFHINEILDGISSDKRAKKRQIHKSKSRDINICEACGHDNTLVINGEVICQKCGVISDTVIDFNAEWRYYGSDDSKFSDPNT